MLYADASEKRGDFFHSFHCRFYLRLSYSNFIWCLSFKLFTRRFRLTASDENTRKAMILGKRIVRHASFTGFVLHAVKVSAFILNHMFIFYPDLKSERE